MKTKSTLSFLLSLLLLSPCANAQQKDTGFLRKEDHFSSLWVSYTPSITYKYADKSITDDKYHVVSLGWLETSPVSTTAPIMFEFGGIVDYWLKSYEDKNERILSAKVPFNLLTSFGLADNFSLYPFAGLNAKLNLLGEKEYNWSSDGDSKRDSYNLFKDNPELKRFVFGYQLGIRARYERVLFSFGFESSITALYTDNRKYSMLSFGVGYMF